MVGRNDAPYASPATRTAAIASPSWSLKGFCALFASPITSPTAAPAKTKPAHGKSVKLVLPGEGRKYHSTGSGSQLSHGVIRTIGVNIEIAPAASANATVLDRPA